MARVRANLVAELVAAAPLAMAEIPGHGQGIADARAIGKPPTYAGDEESWRNWRFKLENCVACLGTQRRTRWTWRPT
eukprot:2953920-Alexandrium_andersonii.AAC.1